MKRLFTPWRMSYLTSPSSETGCIFCKASSSASETEVLRLWSGARVFVMLNRYPYSNGHLMVAPHEHSARLFESGDQTLSDLIRVAARAQQLLGEVYEPEGFNLGMNFGSVAGAGFADHYHLHLVPRWRGDHNFMSVTADTRMIPETLDVTFERLAPKFSSLSGSF